MDFRSDAVKATLRELDNRPGAALSDLGQSGCIPVSAGRRFQTMVELPALLASIACMCAVPALLIGGLLGLLLSHLVLPLLVANLALLLVLRRIKSWFLRVYLAARRDSLLKVLSNLPKKYVGLEDGNTYDKAKLVIEDEGVCLLDSKRQRLLIEGCSHRYVICAKDVNSVEPVSGYGMSGALLDFTIAGQDLKVMLSVAGHGPLASLIQAFVPGKSAKDLVSILNATLFATDAPPL